MAQDDVLDGLFAEAAAEREVPSDGLITRILADAEALQPQPRAFRAAPAAPQGWFSTLADWFGGGLSLAGMSAAAVTGLYLGVAQPVALLTLTELVTGSTTIDSLELLPASGTLWAQE